MARTRLTSRCSGPVCTQSTCRTVGRPLSGQSLCRPTGMTRNRRLALLGCLVVGIGYGMWLDRPGVRVTVRNSTDDDLTGVSVRVSGREYPIGVIAAGESACVRVSPSGDSNVAVSYETTAARTEQIDCYISSGYRGSCSLEVRTDGSVHTDDSIRLFPWWIEWPLRLVAPIR
jgi:hypothetical protein